MTKLSKKIVSKIKKEHIKPHSRLHFLLIRGMMWFCILLSIHFGSVAIAIILRHLSGAELPMAQRFAHGNPMGFVIALPYLWIAFTAGALILAKKI